MSLSFSRDDSMDILPPGLAELPAVQRRQSVFHDLMTVFRKNTLASRQTTYHSRSFSPSSRSTSDKVWSPQGETETFVGKSDGKENEIDEEGKPLTRSALLERIRQKKEVIGKLRCQAWSMSRKRRTLKLAQKNREQNESKVSKTHLYKEEMKKKLSQLGRYLTNFKTYLIPWEGKIKKMESHFGFVVSSYFTFLRWVVFINIIITIIMFAFVVGPEVISALLFPHTSHFFVGSFLLILLLLLLCLHLLLDQKAMYATLRYSMVNIRMRIRMPLGYFVATLFIFAYSFFAILRKMAANARMSKLSGSKNRYREGSKNDKERQFNSNFEPKKLTETEKEAYDLTKIHSLDPMAAALHEKLQKKNRYREGSKNDKERQFNSNFEPKKLTETEKEAYDLTKIHSLDPMAAALHEKLQKKARKD